MPLLDTIKQMQDQNLSEPEIVQKLREQGYNAKDINEALSQSKIKAAVSNQNNLIQSMTEMQPSIMTQPEMPVEIPQPQATETPEYIYPTPQAYQGYEYYQPPQLSTETITEISEQIMNEKLSEIKKNIGNIAEFKTLMEARIEGIDDRLRRMEAIIEKLQTTILGKIGNYFQNIQEIKNEMEAMQESFSKVVNPLVDRGRQVEKQMPREKPERKKAGKHPIEDYLAR